MGLDTSHNCWHGAYSAFHRWRKMLAHVAGLPPLELMEGFFDKNKAVTGNPFWECYEKDKEQGWADSESIWNRLPIKWDCLKPSALHILLYHEDCEGEIAWKDCLPLAKALEELLPLMPNEDAGGHIGHWHEKTQQFIDGLMAAHQSKENVDFH